MGKHKNEFGITCMLSDRGCSVLLQALKQIQRRRPKDFEKLKHLVQAIKRKRWTDGTLGEIKRMGGGRADDEGLDEVDRRVIVYLDDRQSDPSLIATIAHEFGHVCSTYQDIDRRGMPDDEWASESTADWYAYKWGFGRQIATWNKTRCFHHHGPKPGEPFELFNRHYRLTRAFRVVEIK